MPILLYDLTTADDRRLSPYCWRAKLALAHKGLAFETIPTPFTKIAAIPGGGQTTVPVVDFDGTLVRDSFAIAEYLEEAWPDRPSLFGGEGGRAACRFVESWAATLMMRISPIVLKDIHDRLAPEDQAYFRASREKRFGKTLEEVVADREARLPAFREALLPLKLMLKAQPWLGGAAPSFADYIVFGSLQWPRLVCPLPLIEGEDVVRDWFDRCLDLHDGLGRKAPAAAP